MLKNKACLIGNTWLARSCGQPQPFFLKLIKHEVVHLISAFSKVWDCHFNLLEPIWMHFLFLSLPRNEKLATRVSFQVRVRSDLAEFFLVA